MTTSHSLNREFIGTAEPFYEIFVRDLVLPCRIGVFPHEHEAPQQVRFNVDVRMKSSETPTTDNIDDVMSYDDIVNGIKGLLAQGHINLVETLAEQIASLCLSNPHAAHVRIMIEKLDVLASPATLGVRLTRSKATY